MLKIFSLVENEEMIEKLETSLENTEYQIEWLAHEAKLYDKLRIHDEAIVLLPKSYVYNIYKVSSFLTQQLPKIKVVLVLESESELDSQKAGTNEVLFLNSSEIRETILHLIGSYREKLNNQKGVEIITN